MKQSGNIGFITCYFGELPWYFDYFVNSCKYNPSVDFYIITNDHTYKNPVPKNVRLIYKTLDDVNAVATEKLGFEINITYGYKFCDFKPAFGLIFSELLKGYDFWGHCDIDIIFGNIRDFITDELLENYDVISVRHDWLTGCFLLYKNIDKINRLFMYSKDYKKVFTSEQHYCFDETNFAHDAFSAGEGYNDIDTEIESMTHVVKKLEAENQIKPFFDFFIIEGVPGKLKWVKGKMFYRNRYEVLLYHLIFLKKTFAIKTNRIIPDHFRISPTRIYHR